MTGKRVSNSLLSGLRLPIQGARLLLRLPQLKRVAILPIIVTFVIYIAVAGIALWWIAHWDWSVGENPWQFWGGFGAWLHGALDQSLEVVKWVLALPLLLAICYFTFTAVGMVLASPFNDILSERIERAICQEQYRPSISWKEQGKLILVSVIDSLTILVRQIGWILVSLPFLIIPYLGFIPLFLVTAYHTGLGFVDVAMARNYLRHRHKKILIQHHRKTLMGIGLAMELLFLIPFMGLFILPLGVAAGTLIYCRFDWETHFKSSRMEAPEKFVCPKLRSSFPP